MYERRKNENGGDFLYKWERFDTKIVCISFTESNPTRKKMGILN